MTRRYRTALVGVGKVGASYANDPLTQRFYQYISHAQVLANHPSFAWDAAVDPNASALAEAQARWGFRHAARTIEELIAQYDPEVLVIATPPTVRLDPVVACPNLKAVLCEKPLGNSIEEAKSFLDHCDARNILVQVNLWRRCDELYGRLAAGHLQELIGRPQAAHGVYGNGLLNNGTHIVDMCRMMLGEVAEVSVLGLVEKHNDLPLANDFDVSFSLTLADGMVVTLQALDFRFYREIALDIWGENGRLELLNEGLTNRLSRRAPHRALVGADEIAVDAPEMLAPTVGDALYRVYDNLAAALRGDESLRSSGASAWSTAVIIDAIRKCAEAGNRGPLPIKSGRLLS